MSYKYLQDKSYYENLYDKQTVSLCRAGEKTVNSIFSEMEKKASKAELVKHQAGWYLWYSIFYFQFVESLAAQRYQDREKAIQEKAGSDQEKDNLLETSRPRKSYFCLRCGKDMALISKEYMPRKKSSSNNWGLTLVLPIVYTLGMSKYAVINLKTDPELKQLAAKTADRLGISISAVLNNELRRFTAEQSVVFDVPEVPNDQTARILASSKKEIDSGDYHKFNSNNKAVEFLAKELK